MTLVAANDALHALRPDSLESFVGQEHLKEQLRPWIAESRKTRSPMAHCLAISEPGMGKTTLAEVIANELGDPFTTIDLSRMTERQFISFMRHYEGGFLFVDEAHRAKDWQQEQLLTLMEPEGFVSTQYGGKIYVKWNTVIAATTEPHKLLGTFTCRFPVSLEYEPYSEQEMKRIIVGMAGMLETAIDEESLGVLATASAGNPRTARHLVRTWRAHSFVADGPHLEKVLEACGRERDGLSTKHLQYLRKLDQLDGTSGERTLANHLRVHPSELWVLERLLVDRGLVAMPSTGRTLTPAGDARLRGKTTQWRRLEKPDGIETHRIGRVR